ncbi:hypothetical protein [Pseudorhizobium flavum]|uniref:Putative membrane-anchored protein n=1 Tax=Pseudorhizobium flavum TaxID=1335061 RepID=A0A7X0DDS8_9HYPH|nr:hypothetical protein [Pseudorhizobium flavum]MBB6181025.1 putative membrane-anchored protein [Pseudorhizobium flavum]CAD6601659.1 hypothetical protein RFYW14_00928 [Pseudorhizobium flavum]
MSRRLRNLLFAFTLSLSMWAIILYASVALYGGIVPQLDPVTTAGIE